MKVKTLCTRYELNRKEVDDAIRLNNIKQFKERGAWCVTDEDAQTIVDALSMPEPLKPKLLTGRVLASCRNSNWVYVKFDDMDGKHPVLIPRQFKDRLVGKQIRAEVIEDRTGTTYRHEYFARVR